MKKLFTLMIAIQIFTFKISFAQNTFPSTGAAGIGTTTPDASSLLEVKSTTKGVLIPRMTKTQRDAIALPTEGLLIYQTNSAPGFYYYDGSAWGAVTPKAGANKSLSNLTAPTAVNVDLLPAADYGQSLGSAAHQWDNLYLLGSVYIGGARFLGSNAGTGLYNTNVGGYSGISNSIGYGNTATGYSALYSTTTGYYNTANGFEALNSNIDGVNNTATGASSLHANTSGSFNTAIGADALSYNTSGSNNTANGYLALFLNTTGSGNTVQGIEALSNNTTGSQNTACGYLAMVNNLTGYSNVAIGSRALYLSNQSNIVAVGDSALYNNGGSGSLDGTANTALGSKALFANTTGRANSAFGFQCGFSNTTGIHNTSGGYQGMYALTTGSDNTSLGYKAGLSLLTGSSNTFLGSAADCGSLGTVTNSTAIGNGASVTNSNNFVFGNGSVTKWGFGKTAAAGNIIDFINTTAKLTTGGVWTNASDRKLKDHFEKLESKDILDKVNALDIQRWHYIADGEPTTHIGPIAQDFHAAFGVGDDTTISTIDPSGVALLAIQALSKKNDEKDAKIADQQKQIDDLKNMMLDMQTTLSQCCMSYQSSMANKNASTSSDAPKLEQNVPNPFGAETIIQFYVPQQVSSAQIIVSDLSGQVLKTFELTGSGVNQVRIHSNELAAGAYQYALLINGKVIDTKQMVLTK